MDQQIAISGISQSIRENLGSYFDALQGEIPTGIYDMVVDEVERALLSFILECCQANRSKAARMLGLNRNSLAAKIKKHQLIVSKPSQKSTTPTQSVKRALISVSDKEGVVDFAKGLVERGYEILSTGGTAKLLHEAKVPVVNVGDYINFPEILEGRVKTLHPKIHGGILAKRDNLFHMQTLAQQNIPLIDLVCVNLYPFENTIKKKNVSREEAIENIDIGGPAMIRSSAKNWQGVAIVTDKNDYTSLLQAMQSSETGDNLSEEYRLYLATKAFAYTARYDTAINNYLKHLQPTETQEPSNILFPPELIIKLQRRDVLRYGENPHQQAAFYIDEKRHVGSIADYQQLQGKPLSYNNIMDADAAWEMIKLWDSPACVIIKHANPCGVAVAESALQAYKKAFSADKKSAFGGIIAFNREVDGVTAQTILMEQFVEVVMAPGFSDEALQNFSCKNNVRVLKLALSPEVNALEYKRVGAGLLVQTGDHHPLSWTEMKVVSQRQPSLSEQQDLTFLWNVVKFVKSNAVVFGKNGQAYGIGAGQMSRVDAVVIAAHKAQESQWSLQGASAASDAFFPFRDGIDAMAAQGISAVIQPGGSIRDEEVIRAADEHGMVMVFTGIRHFKH